MMVARVLSCEQLEDRLAALHRASLEVIQDISLESLLERIATIACEQVDAQFAAVGVLDESGELDHFIPVGISSGNIQRTEHPLYKEEWIRQLFHIEETCLIPGNGHNQAHSYLIPEQHPYIKTFLSVPVRQAENHMGHICLVNKLDESSFSYDDQQVIETLAAYAAVSISNARLYHKLIERDVDLTQRNRNLALLNDLAASLTSSNDIDQILDRTLSRVMEYLNLEVGDVYLRKEKGRTLTLVRHHGNLFHALCKRSQLQVGEDIVGKIAQNGQPEQIVIPENDGYDLQFPAAGKRLRNAVGFPLTGQREVLGVMVFASTSPQSLDEQDMQFLVVLGSWLGTAIENMRLNIQQRRLAVLEERERIGMDLHDGIIQSIYAVGLTLEHARLLMDEDVNQARQRIARSIGDLNNVIRDIRTYILDLRPRQLHDENLVQGVQRLISEFRANTLVEVSINSQHDGLENLPGPQALALFHICQEALANVAKHARANHVEVSLWSSPDRALLEISDNGNGMDLKKIRTSIGHGMSNMQTRAHNAGGDLEIFSELTKGTTILAWVPFKYES